MPSLFQVPQPSLGLMGRLPASRIQGRNGRGVGLAGMTLEDLLLADPQPAATQMADPIDEAMMARRAEDERLAALASAPSRPRERVGFGSVLGRTLAPNTFAALDAERARLQAEADRPRAEARQMENERIARAMGPQALLALRLNGEKLGGEVAEGYGTDVVAAGSGLFRGGQRVGEQATYAESGDETLQRDSGGVRPVYTRTAPSITEQVNIGELGVKQDQLGLNAVDAYRPRTVTTPTGSITSLMGADGTIQGQIQGRPPASEAVDPAKAAQARAGRIAMADSMDGALAGARPFLNTAGVWSELNPFNRQGRANLEGHLDTLKGNLTFEKLMEMKQNSPTGASGLGALSDNEARLLSSTVAALNPEMDAAQLERSFAIIERLTAKMREEAAAPAASGVTGPRLSPEAARALPPGTRFVGMDGVERVRQ